MRRSQQIAIPLLAASAVAVLAGCNRKEMQRCVDETGKVVDPKLCANLPANLQNQPLRPAPGGFYGYNNIIVPHIYRTYYGGEGSYSYGSSAYGGSYSPTSGHSYSSTSGVSSSTVRGGFGSSFSSHGFGGGE